MHRNILIRNPDPDNADEIASAQSEFLQNAANGKKLQEEYDKNMPSSY